MVNRDNGERERGRIAVLFDISVNVFIVVFFFWGFCAFIR